MIIVPDKEDFDAYAPQCAGIEITDAELDEAVNTYLQLLLAYLPPFLFRLGTDQPFSAYLKELLELKGASK